MPDRDGTENRERQGDMLKRKLKKYDGVRAAGPVAGPTRLSTTMELWQMAVPFVISLYLCATAERERKM